MGSKLRLTTEIVYLIPRIPNFIMHESKPRPKQNGFTEGPKTPIGGLTDNQLIEIADQWKLNLLEKARSDRMRRG